MTILEFVLMVRDFSINSISCGSNTSARSGPGDVNGNKFDKDNFEGLEVDDDVEEEEEDDDDDAEEDVCPFE